MSYPITFVRVKCVDPKRNGFYGQWVFKNGLSPWVRIADAKKMLLLGSAVKSPGSTFPYHSTMTFLSDTLHPFTELTCIRTGRPWREPEGCEVIYGENPYKPYTPPPVPPPTVKPEPEAGSVFGTLRAAVKPKPKAEKAKPKPKKR